MKWEYLVMKGDRANLAQLGQAGWELVSVVPIYGKAGGEIVHIETCTMIYYFKRLLNNTPQPADNGDKV